MTLDQNSVLSISGVVVSLISIARAVSHQLRLRESKRATARKRSRAKHRAAANKPK